MKLSRLTSVLINVALALLIVILVKVLITAPQPASAALNKEYLADFVGENFLKKSLEDRAKAGWRFIFAIDSSAQSEKILIFER
jgi:hypothetical protein